MNTVGLIGVGAMGKALLHRLKLAGFAIQAYDISKASLDAAEQAGARAMSSAAEAASGASHVHVFVRTDDEVIEAALGPKGALTGLVDGAILFLHSTTLPATTQRVAEAAAKQGVAVVDAPITAIPQRVEAGEAVFLVGGSGALIAQVRPHLARLGARICHFGPLGAGNAAKLAKNLGNGVERIVLMETMRIVEAAGLNPLQVIEMMHDEDSGSVLSRWQGAFNVEGGRLKMRKVLNILDKDLPLAAELGRSLGVEFSVIPEAAQIALKYMEEEDGPVYAGGTKPLAT